MIGPVLILLQRLERGVSKDCWECGPTVSTPIKQLQGEFRH